MRIDINKLLVLEKALSTFCWFKGTLKSFLQKFFQQNNIIINNIDWNLPKKEISSYIINTLNNHDKNNELLMLIKELINIDDFSEFDLHNKEEAKKQAQLNISTLRMETNSYFDEIVNQKIKEDKIKIEIQKKNDIQDFLKKLEEIKKDFINTTQIINSQERGRKLEKILYDIFLLYNLNPKKAFVCQGQQIDGAFSFDNTEYILEAKYTKSVTQTSDIYAFHSKINSKLDNTLGLFISMNGFSSNATLQINGARCNYLLMNGAELMSVLENRNRLDNVLKIKKEHCATKGEPFYEVK